MSSKTKKHIYVVLCGTGLGVYIVMGTHLEKTS